MMVEKTGGIEEKLSGLAALVVIVLACAGLAGCGSGGESAADAAKSPAAAREAYREYLLESVEAMNAENARLREEIEAGNIDGAKSSFAASQVPFGHLKPALTLSTVGEALLSPPDGAYPQIERSLWGGGVSGRTVEAATEAVDSTDRLEKQLRTMDLSPPIVAANGRRTIDEIIALDLELEANPYSHLDVLLASANLEGVKAAFESIRPALAARDRSLPPEMEREFEAAFTALEEFGVPAYKPKGPDGEEPGTAFDSGDQLTPEDLHPVHAAGKKLAALFNRSLKTLLAQQTQGAREE